MSLGGPMLTFGSWCQKARGSIVFGNTREALDEGIIGSYPFSLRPEEDTLPVTLFAREVQGFCAWYSREPVCLPLFLVALRVTDEDNAVCSIPPRSGPSGKV
ncbi:hypothetical protein BS47DRAFT_1350668 [Hydnum rufescens UP504]|uniref:Uncharacterized protein n=1 Tax=Hydnum rufescens UP504 TaxID=1448309 RepID=A0A9P6AME4_9AGAM|nr:hypothetical protein BS47DRAFT_1350668 [Hydnum rufescens UP504]